jgi:Tn3 transposase DDE domain
MWFLWDVGALPWAAVRVLRFTRAGVGVVFLVATARFFEIARDTSAVHVTARFGSVSRGDPLYEAVVHLGRLLRPVFLCDYFLNDVFRRELLRVLDRGEAVNSLKRAIYTGRIASDPRTSSVLAANLSRIRTA